nr:hypothetical protein [Tanacetum cinerariifolium]
MLAPSGGGLILYKAYGNLYAMIGTRNDTQTGQFGNQRIVTVVRNRETIELEAHYMYMVKIQEVLHAVVDNSGPTYDVEPLEKLRIDNYYNVFTNENNHSKQPASINDTYMVEKTDRNIFPHSSDMYNNERKDYQNVNELENVLVFVASLIANLKLDVDENKIKHKQLKKANTSLSQDLEKRKQDLLYCKSELEKYKILQTKHKDKEKVELECEKALGLLTQNK